MTIFFVVDDYDVMAGAILFVVVVVVALINVVVEVVVDSDEGSNH